MLDVQIIICFCGVCPMLEGFCRAKSVICGQGERHRNNILYKLKYGRGANCERSHYMKTAGRKCIATAENLQVQSDHQTVTLHLAWRLRSADRYLPYRTGWIRCHTFVCSLSLFFHFVSSVLLPWKTWHLSSLIPIPLPSSFPPASVLYFTCLLSCPSCLSIHLSNLSSSRFRRMFLPAPTFAFKRARSCFCHPLSLSVCGQSHLI